MAEFRPQPLTQPDARIPWATYRLQFHAQFTLQQAVELVEYLAALGISDYYASPLFAARPGSTHGYDVIDPTRLNPELGTEETLHALAAALRTHGMGMLLDVVPNHMCIAGSGNEWWNDLLENGPGSPYAAFFDIDWRPPKHNLENKVLLPILGDQYGRVLENQELQLTYQRGSFFVRYYATKLPIAPRASILILAPLLQALPAKTPSKIEEAQRAELESIIFALEHLPPRHELEPEKIKHRRRETEIAKRRLSALVSANREIRRALDRVIRDFNGVKGAPYSFDRLEELLAAQAYRLSFWRVAADEINYRRFFDVNELAAIRIEEPKVFAAVHGLAFRLLREGVITGLRIDHIDGLLDPERYLEQLRRGCRKALKAAEKPARFEPGQAAPNQAAPNQAALGQVGPNQTGLVRGRPTCYVVVEKILGATERLRTAWATHGTTGYEFLNLLNGLFVDERSQAAFQQIWRRLAGETEDFEEVAYEGKKLILHAAMSGELHVLARSLERIAEQHRYSRDFTLNSLHQALGEVIACFPVYRSYIRLRPDPAPAASGAAELGSAELGAEDRRSILTAVRRAQRRNPSLSKTIFAFIRALLLLEEPDGLALEQRRARRNFVLRFQQLTGPVTAKGVEDTAFYRYYPLASLCEVGGHPTRFGTSRAAFHDANQQRLKDWPHTLLATSTHDTKRSEDVRARLNVLSELPAQWERTVRRWQRLNRKFKTDVDEAPVPDAREEYLLYQTLIGAFPFQLGDDHDAARQAFLQRIQEYMVKALREAKLHSSWLNPNEEHEQAVREFTARVLAPNGRFLPELLAFQTLIARAGAFNSLAQTLLKITVPGVPDFYQGTESWDFSLVDPDNRQPVDYVRRQQLFQTLPALTETGTSACTEELLRTLPDGRIKLFVLSRALNFRRRQRALFERGQYLPLPSSGARARHVISFARRTPQQTVLVVATRFFAPLLAEAVFPIGERVWGDTVIQPPTELSGCYRDVFTGKRLCLDEGQAGLPLAQVCEQLPLALLERM